MNICGIREGSELVGVSREAARGSVETSHRHWNASKRKRQLPSWLDTKPESKGGAWWDTECHLDAWRTWEGGVGQKISL